jgi:hypothetical protein
MSALIHSLCALFGGSPVDILWIASPGTIALSLLDCLVGCRVGVASRQSLITSIIDTINHPLH